MVRLSTLLACLLVILTFNAYACILPVPQTTAIDCSSGTEDSVRGTCDVFLELGPQSSHTSNHAPVSVHMDWTVSVSLLSETCRSPVQISNPPRSPDTSLHFSIQTTVLRI